MLYIEISKVGDKIFITYNSLVHSLFSHFQRCTMLNRSDSFIHVASTYLIHYYNILCHISLYYSGCYLGVYSALGVAQALLVFFAVFALAIAAIFASRKLHAKMLKNILRSPMSFFDTTPLGRVLNRFSKDVYVIDEVLPQSARAFLFTFFNVLSSLVVIIVTTPIFVVAIIPLGIFYFLVQVSN